jgi:hypothetical protein
MHRINRKLYNILVRKAEEKELLEKCRKRWWIILKWIIKK